MGVAVELFLPRSLGKSSLPGFQGRIFAATGFLLPGDALTPR